MFVADKPLNLRTQTTITESDQFSFGSFQQDGSVMEHCTATYAPEPARPLDSEMPTFDEAMQRIKGNLDHGHVTHKEAYEGMSNLEFTLGESFKGVQQLWWSTEGTS